MTELFLFLMTIIKIMVMGIREVTFLLTVLTATISLNVLGTPSCRQAMYKQALAIASFALPFRFRPS